MDEDGKIYDAIKIGLFKKDRNYKSEQSKKPIQFYKDILTIGLLQYDDGHDVTISSEYFPDIMKKYEPLSPDYDVDYYSSIMDAIEKDYGIESFNSVVIGKGLVNLETFAPNLKTI